MAHSLHGIQSLRGCPKDLFWAFYFSSCTLMTLQSSLAVNLKPLLAISSHITKSRVYRTVIFSNEILTPVYSGACNGR